MPTATAPWRVICEVHGDNPGSDPEAEAKLAKSKAKKPPVGKNMGGMIIYLSDGGATRREVSRVAFIRRWSKNPDVSFEDQLKAEIEKAQASVEILNKQTEGSGELL